MTIHNASASLGRRQLGSIPQAVIPSGYRDGKPAQAPKSNPKFICAAHGIFARVLSEKGIAWRYKPRTFAIEWDSEGDLLDSITPDFYLPDYRQYIELAVEEETSVCAKARRLDLLGRVHPELDIRLIVGPSYSAAVERFLAGGNWKQ